MNLTLSNFNIHSDKSKKERIILTFENFLKNLNKINQNNLFQNELDFIIE